MSAALVRALAGIRARPGATLATALGLALIGAMLGTAVTTGYALRTGFDRAQREAGTADLIARFDPADAQGVRERLEALPNVRSVSLRRTVRPVSLAATTRGDTRYGSAEVHGLEPGRGREGLAIVAGRALDGVSPGEAVVERGLFEEWGLALGDRIVLGGGWTGSVVGVAVEPDTVAFPLASQPRVYLAREQVAAYVAGGGDDVNAAYVHVVDPDRLPETLVQARVTSFGLTGLQFVTRTGVRALIDQAGGLVVSLLAAFGVLALGIAATMLVATGHARVTRDLPTIGALRALGFTPPRLALSYAAEALVVAAPALALGMLAGSLAVAGPTARLLGALNELPPERPVGPPQLLVLAAASALAALAAAYPAYAAGRRPIVDTLRGATVVRPRRLAVAASPALLGARLAGARPGRFAVTALALAASVATVFLMLALGRFLLEAEQNPAVLGERYSLVVDGEAADLRRVRATPGVGAAAARYETRAIDVFDLREPLTLVAFGDDPAGLFAGRPLLEGRRVRADDEVEVGKGIAQSLGLEVGGTLVAQLAAGGEVRLRVVGVVQELAQDGRVAYARPPALLAGDPTLSPELVVRPAPGVPVGEVRRRLRASGFSVRENEGLLPSGSSFLATVVGVLNVVAVIDGLVCAGLVLLALFGLARERAGVIAVLRTAGAGLREVVALLAGAAALYVLAAVPAAYVLERTLLAPALSGLVARYGTLPLAPTGTHVALVFAASLLVALATGAAAAAVHGRGPVVALLRDE